MEMLQPETKNILYRVMLFHSPESSYTIQRIQKYPLVSSKIKQNNIGDRNVIINARNFDIKIFYFFCQLN